ncbi:MAG: hypothetical protein H0V51_02795 [Chloroflexi bacterium]|nr:hypothetical protein [Chloroflexota bacterium]
MNLFDDALAELTKAHRLYRELDDDVRAKEVEEAIRLARSFKQKRAI